MESHVSDSFEISNAKVSRYSGIKGNPKLKYEIIYLDFDIPLEFEL